MSWLKKLSENRVLDVTWKGNTFLVEEACDYYFSLDLTPDQLIELANELTALANERK